MDSVTIGDCHVCFNIGQKINNNWIYGGPLISVELLSNFRNYFDASSITIEPIENEDDIFFCKDCFDSAIKLTQLNVQLATITKETTDFTSKIAREILNRRNKINSKKSSNQEVQKQRSVSSIASTPTDPSSVVTPHNKTNLDTIKVEVDAEKNAVGNTDDQNQYDDILIHKTPQCQSAEDTKEEITIEDTKEEVTTEDTNEEITTEDTDKEITIEDTKDEIATEDTNEEITTEDTNEEITTEDTNEEITTEDTNEEITTEDTDEEITIVDTKDEITTEDTDEEITIEDTDEEITIVDTKDEITTEDTDEEITIEDTIDEITTEEPFENTLLICKKAVETDAIVTDLYCYENYTSQSQRNGSEIDSPSDVVQESNQKSPLVRHEVVPSPSVTIKLLQNTGPRLFTTVNKLSLDNEKLSKDGLKVRNGKIVHEKTHTKVKPKSAVCERDLHKSDGLKRNDSRDKSHTNTASHIADVHVRERFDKDKDKRNNKVVKMLGQNKNLTVTNVSDHINTLVSNNRQDLLTSANREQMNRTPQTTTGGKQLKCTFCEKQFKNLSTKKEHERIHTGEKPYKCSFCEKSCRLKHNLKAHERIHTGEKPYKCLVCGKSFNQQSSLKNHGKIHSGDRPYKCSICENIFSQKRHLLNHERTHTRDKTYRCTFCDNTYRSSATLKVHAKCHTREAQYKCALFRNPDNLKSPGVTDKEKLGRPDNTGSKQHNYVIAENLTEKVTHKKKLGQPKAPQASRHFQFQGSVATRCTEEMPLNCSYCKRVFANSWILKAHERMHANSKSYECTTCGKTYSALNTLKIHKVIHSDTPYKCKVCNRNLSCPQSLEIHTRIHTGEMPYKCPLCGKLFRHKGTLRLHSKIHHTLQTAFPHKSVH